MNHNIQARSIHAASAEKLIATGVHPILAQLYAARGITSVEDISLEIADIIPPAQLLNADKAAKILADAIQQDIHIVISCDFDVDGCTAASIALRGLRMMGAARVDFAMPHRVTHGYGLSPLLVNDLAQKFSPDLIMTVDCGISSFEGVNEAIKLGIDVLVTDHHLPPNTEDGLPPALCIVNPNQPDCTFPSKNLCGAGVAFYVLLALRTELRARGHFQATGLPDPNLATLLDMVALATVADVVKLDKNNRILVYHGLQRIRAGRACAGIAALMSVAGKEPSKATVYDLGFIIGPRLNAAGRLEDASLGVQCLTTDNDQKAHEIATRLDGINKERREIEAEMKDSAEAALVNVDVGDKYSLVMYNPDWHQGVIGILASRLKDNYGRPTIVFARAGEGKVKGSGRSIPGLHLRDAIDLVSKRYPGMLPTFGGHAAAAGLSCVEERLSEFIEAFECVVRELLDESDLQRIIETDGSMPKALSLDLVEEMESGIWGQGFPAPTFDDEFLVVGQRILKEKHLKLRLARNGEQWDGIWFFHNEELPQHARLVYKLGINEYRGDKTVQMLVQCAG